MTEAVEVGDKPVMVAVGEKVPFLPIDAEWSCRGLHDPGLARGGEIGLVHFDHPTGAGHRERQSRRELRSERLLQVCHQPLELLGASLSRLSMRSQVAQLHDGHLHLV